MFAAVLAAALAFAEGDYTANLKVGAPKTDSKVQKSEGGGKQNTETKATTTSMTLPVKVSFGGKEMPKSVLLKTYFIGTKDGEPAVLGESKTEVTLDAATRAYQGEIVSPPAKFVKTKKTTGGGRRGRNAKTTTEKSGEKITGCIVQLFADGKVVKSFASKPTWKKLAQADPLDTEAVLKFR